MPETARIRFSRGMAAGDASLRLYAILDAESCARRGLPLLEVARAWRDAGVQLIQYRDKTGIRETLEANAAALRDIFPCCKTFLLLNDHPDLAAATGCDGAHVGQTDTAVARAREQLGPDRILGISTHSADQALATHATEADYVAVGPVFATSTKTDAEPVVGLCGVHAARAVVRKPLVAIGGITASTAREVLRVGSGSVALISALLPEDGGLAAVTKQAQDILRALK